jgi:uncharacterized membrane protein
VFLVMGIALALAKVIYIGLLLMLFMIPAIKFKSLHQQYLSLVILIMAPVLVAWGWLSVIMNYYIPYADYEPLIRDKITFAREANYYLQWEHLMTHGFHLLRVIYNTVVRDPDFILVSYVGHFGAYMGYPMPGWSVIITYLIIAFIALKEKDSHRIAGTQKLVLLVTALVTFILLVVSQHLSWNAVGKDIVESLQGRYLVPVLPLVFLLLDNNYRPFKTASAILAVALVLFINFYGCKILYERFIKHEPVMLAVTFEEKKDNISAYTVGKKRSGKSVTFPSLPASQAFPYRSSSCSLLYLE